MCSCSAPAASRLSCSTGKTGFLSAELPWPSQNASFIPRAVMLTRSCVSH